MALYVVIEAVEQAGELGLLGASPACQQGSDPRPARVEETTDHLTALKGELEPARLGYG
jgi:hypothetical protein